MEQEIEAEKQISDNNKIQIPNPNNILERQKPLIHNEELDPQFQIENNQKGVFQVQDFRNRIEMKEDHENYPLLLSCGPEKYIYVDTKHPRYKESYEFLIQIAQYVSRPVLIHTYQVTLFSVYAAMVLGTRDSDQLLNQLYQYSKNKYIPTKMYHFIKENSQKYGSATISLLNLTEKKGSGKYILKIDEEEYNNLKMKNGVREVLDNLLQLDETEEKEAQSQMENKEDDYDENQDEQIEIENNELNNDNINNSINNNNGDMVQLIEDQQQIQVKDKSKKVIKYKYFEIPLKEISLLCQTLLNEQVPYVQQYDYEKQDQAMGKPLDISKVYSTKLRSYQIKSLDSIFRKGKARSGIIILPCGAGKTLTGVMICKNIRRSTIILCERDVQVDQWRDTFHKFCVMDTNRILTNLGGKDKGKSALCFKTNPLFKDRESQRDWDRIPAFILILTYKQLSSTLKYLEKTEEDIRKFNDNQKDAYKKAQFIKHREWGLLIADECQTLPANTYRNVLNLKYKVKIGLTATPYRGDGNISLLYERIGPKLYEENLLDLINGGYLATPYCIDVRCQMHPEFKILHDEAEQNRQKTKVQSYHQGNPIKFKGLKYLIDLHESRGDKIIIFIDAIPILDLYASYLKRPRIHGKSEKVERLFIFDCFKKEKIQTILVSRIGDTGIDLPDANVGIQISGQFKSQRQEVQRLGRIMRKKENQCGEVNAFFYNFVSMETNEVGYCQARQTCLIDQGLSFEIIEEKNLYDQNYQIDEENLNQFTKELKQRIQNSRLQDLEE